MAQSAAKDAAMSLALTNDTLSASQTVIAQWNHNYYTDQAIYGYYQKDSRTVMPSDMLASNTSLISKTFTNNAELSLATISTPFNDSSANGVRIMFETRISEATNLDESVNDFSLKVSTGTEEFTSTFPLKINEGSFDSKEVIYVSNVFSSEIFSQLTLSLYPINEVSPGGSVTVEIKNIYVTYLSSVETRTRQADRLSWVFNPNKPGDQILENDLLSRSRPATKYHIATNSFTDKKRSPEIFSFLISPFNREITYLAAGKTSQYKNIFVEYRSAVPSNQIYIKTQDIYTSINGELLNARNLEFRVYLKINGTWSSTPIYEETSSTSQFLTNGSIILQYNGSTWNDGFDKSYIPKMSTADGSFSNTVDIQGISIQVKNEGKDASRVIEISPRLALDLSDFLVSSEYEMSIDGGQYPIPIGLSNMNTGNIVLENMPRESGGNKYQIFDNNQYSTLNDLIKSNVKFTVYTTVQETRTGASQEIKSFTMYADEWQQDDLETATVSLTDGARILQSTPCNEFLLIGNYHSSLIGTIRQAVEYLLQTSGFSDYDVDSLEAVSDRLKNSYGVSIPIFFAKSADNVWDVLSKFLLGYQISCFFDENGILQFRDILRESSSGTFYSDSSSYFNITNTTIGGSIPNLASIKIEKKRDIGELTINYRQLSETNSLFSVNGTTVDNTAVSFNSKLNVSTMYSKTNPWEITTENTGLICANIVSPVSKEARSIRLGDWTGPESTRTNAGKPRFITGFNGYGIIEGEIVAWDGIQYQFSPQIPGFPIYETIRSTEELNDSVSRRINALTGELTVTSISLNLAKPYRRMLISTSGSHSLNINQSVRATLYDTTGALMMDKAFTVDSISSSNSFYVNLLATPFPTGTLGDSSILIRDPSKVSFWVTGNLMNVRRGLFGTNANYHNSTTTNDPAMFVGRAANNATPGRFTLGYSFSRIKEPDNAYSISLPTKVGQTTFVGFHKIDSEAYDEYTFVMTPKTDLDGLGIFLGASVAVPVTGSVAFSSAATGAFANGLFIELFSPSSTVKYGVQVRGVVNRSSSTTMTHYSNQKLLNDAYKPRVRRVEYKKDSNGNIIKDDEGNPIVVKRWWQYFPAKQQVVKIRLEGRSTKKLYLYVNGIQVRFTKKSDNSTLPYLTVPTTFKRLNRSFGMFMRNETSDSAITINNILAGTSDQILDREITWTEAGLPRVDDLNYLISNQHGQAYSRDPRRVNGFSEGVRPFILRSEPVIRGLAIFDVKYNGDAPFFDLKPFGPQGTNGTQTFPPNWIQKSDVIGTPFRGRVAYRNTTGEVAPLAGGENYVKAKILGRSINIASDKKETARVFGGATSDKLEISCPWVVGEGTVQKLLLDMSKRVNSRNSIYEVEIFGSPALMVGDYVNLTYTDKAISSKTAVVQRISHNFSDGGISTSISLRDAN